MAVRDEDESIDQVEARRRREEGHRVPQKKAPTLTELLSLVIVAGLAWVAHGAAFLVRALLRRVDKLPAWAGVLLGAAIAGLGAYAAERWLSAWVAYGVIAVVVGAAAAMAWSGEPMVEEAREPRPEGSSPSEGSVLS